MIKMAKSVRNAPKILQTLVFVPLIFFDVGNKISLISYNFVNELVSSPIDFLRFVKLD